MINERALWLLDQKINRRGFYCDLELADAAIAIVEKLEKEAKKELKEITDGAVSTPGQFEKMAKWLASENVIIPNMQAPTVEEFLKKDISEKAKRLLRIRQIHGRSSVKKYQAIKDGACEDGFVRDTLLFNGAHTGRWTARRVQPHNFLKPEYDRLTIEEIGIPLIKERNIEDLNFYFKDPVSIISSTVRSAICAPPGYDLIAADYSGIEARGLHWHIKDTETLEKIRKGKKIYEEMASLIFNKPEESILKPSFERDVGKETRLGGGYQMGPPKFRERCKTKGLDISRSLSELAINTYRESNPLVVTSWRTTNRDAIKAVKQKTKVDNWSLEGDFLFYTLPSGRRLAYKSPKIGLNRFGRPGLTYMGADSKTKKWVRRDTYGGSLIENIVQAICRDIMAEAMLLLEEKGYLIVLTVHDEILCIVKKGQGSLEEFESILTIVPKWARGFPIAAEGWRGKRYRK